MSITTNFPGWLEREEADLLARLEREQHGPPPTPLSDIHWMRDLKRTMHVLHRLIVTEAPALARIVIEEPSVAKQPRTRIEPVPDAPSNPIAAAGTACPHCSAPFKGPRAMKRHVADAHPISRTGVPSTIDRSVLAGDDPADTLDGRRYFGAGE